MHAALVFDDGPGAGTGHRRRMEALARALAGCGHVPHLHAGASEAVAPVVVVDSLRWRADDPARFSGEVVAAVDLLGRNLHVDVLIDPRPGVAAGLHDSARLVLAGARYALVDPAPAYDVVEPVREVLVAPSADDDGEIAVEIVRAIVAAAPDLNVVLVDGHTFEYQAEQVLGSVDVVVTSGGASMYDALVRGLPTIAVAFDPAQHDAIAALHDARSLVEGNLTTIGKTVETVVCDERRRRALAWAARATVDGNGSARVVAELERLFAIREKMPA